VKAELQIDSGQMVAEITREVVKAIQPLLDRAGGQDDTILTVEELATYLRVSDKWVYSHKHKMPHFKLEGLLRFRKRDIDKNIEKLGLNEKLKRLTTI
jgi:excisionase family DNA binding protein